jgi:hypothetical protein
MGSPVTNTQRFSVVRHGCTTLIAAAAFATASTLLAAAVPDMSGPWEILRPAATLKTVKGDSPPLTTAGQELYARNQANTEADPIKSCLPPGIPRAMTQPGFPFSIIEGQAYLGMMLQWNHLPRIIYLNQAHFENIGPEYLGQSVAHWEGKVLVIDSTGYNDKTWLDESGLPHSEALHTVERIRLTSADRLEDTIRFEDPAIFSAPWTARLIFRRLPGALIKEDYCLGRTGQGFTVVK